MSALAREYGDNADQLAPILKQAAREALLLMASDWQFCISTGGAKDYSEVRLRNHYDNFQALAESDPPRRRREGIVASATGKTSPSARPATASSRTSTQSGSRAWNIRRRREDTTMTALLTLRQTWKDGCSRAPHRTGRM